MPHGPLATLSSFVLCAALLGCSSTPAGSPAPASLAPLLDSIEQRLAIADQVALSKWDSRKSVEDLPREREVVAKAVALAAHYGLNEETVAQFFSAQIEANKLVQYALLSDWHLRGRAPDIPRPDLNGQIRPQLDQLQLRLLQQLATFSAYRTASDCPRWLATARKAAARDALHELAMTRATAQLCTLAKG